MDRTIHDLTPRQLRRAAVLKERIESLQAELERILSGEEDAGDIVRPKRQMTEAGRARIVAAQKRRWEKKKKGTKKK